jgi:hypothetical protein
MAVVYVASDVKSCGKPGNHGSHDKEALEVYAVEIFGV